MPPEFDYISVDVYAGYLPGSKGMDEVVAAKAMRATGLLTQTQGGPGAGGGGVPLA